MFLVRPRCMVRLKNYLKFFRLKQTEYGKYLKRIAEQDYKQYKEIFEGDLFNAN